MKPSCAWLRGGLCFATALWVGHGAADDLTPGTEDFLVRTWDQEDGLPHASATALAQTPDGFLWVGTFDGLVRFDGLQMKVYRRETTPGLPSDAIVRLHVHANGALWVGTDNGLARLWRATWQPYGKAQGWPGDLPKSFAEAPDGTLYVSTGTNILRVDGDKLTLFPSFDRGADTSTLTIAIDRHGTLWAMGLRHLAQFQDGAWHVVLSPGEVAGAELGGLAAARDGGLWVADALRIRKWKEGQWRQTFPRGAHFERDIPVSLLEDGQGNLWAGGFYRGLQVFRPDGRTLKLTKAEGLLANAVTSVFECREGAVWAGTRGGGLARFMPRLFKFYGAEAGLEGIGVNSIAEFAPGRFLAGSTGLYPFEEGSFRDRLMDRSAGMFESTTVYAVLRDRHGTVWLGVEDRGVVCYDSNGLHRFELPVSGPIDVYALFECSQGFIWMGSNHGLLRSGPGSGEFKTYSIKDGLPAGRITLLGQAPSGEIWAGHPDRGLFCLRGDRFEPVLHPGSGAHLMGTALCTEPGSALWVGAADGSLRRFDARRFTEYDARHRLLSDPINCILADAERNLWLSTDGGIVRLDRASLDAVADGTAQSVALAVFGRRDGVRSSHVSDQGQPCGCLDSQGWLWFTSIRGLAAVDPRAVHPQSWAPQVWFDEVIVSGVRHSLLPGSVSEIIVPRGPRHLEITCAAPCLTAAEGLRFSHWVEGWQPQWSDPHRAGSFHLPDLPAGRHQLRVRVIGWPGTCTGSSPPEATLTLIVLPFFWETWWFRAGLALSALSSIAVGGAVWSRRRLRRELEQLHQRQTLAQERMRIAQDLHDDIGGRITEITLLGELAQRQADSAAGVQSALQTITGKMRELAGSMDEIVWALNSRNDTPRQIAAFLSDFAQELYRASSIQCRLDVSPELPDVTVGLTLRHQTVMAVKEALHNALKHAQAREVRLGISYAAGTLRIRVDDDGKGFQLETGRRAGNGLASMQARMERISGSLRIISQPNRGTSVLFDIPISPHDSGTD